MAIIVNFFAGPGAGKSTTATGLFSLLKQHHVKCEFISEFAKDLVWEERKCTFENQYYIFGKQHHRQWRAAKHLDLVVVDSPLLLSAVYRTEQAVPSFEKMVVEVFKEQQNINFFVRRAKPYFEIGRNENEKQAREVDDKVMAVLQKYEIPFNDILGDYSGINNAAEIVLAELSIAGNLNYFMDRR